MGKQSKQGFNNFSLNVVYIIIQEILKKKTKKQASVLNWEESSPLWHDSAFPMVDMTEA